MRSLAWMVTLLFWVTPLLAQKPIYTDANYSHAERARDLVSRMTLDEKISQLQNNAAPIPHLGIEAYDWWSEALHGVGRAGLATVFPQAIGMAASFDEALLEEVFKAVSDEARAKYHAFRRAGVPRKRYQGLTFWTPNINIFRDPRWGRGQETYGEDPYLTTRLGLACVRGLQGDTTARFDKLHACAKHYAVHSGPEWNRHSFDAKGISQRDLRETYLPAFEALVRAGVKEVMGAYNRFEGVPCNASEYLLDELLRKEWGYRGIVVSDCGAIRDFYRKGDHETHTDAAEASAAAVKAGCDLECGGSFAALGEAVARGLVSEAEIDRAVTRLMEARISLGMFEEEEPYQIPYSVVDCDRHRALAKQMALESFVLLQNRNQLLPLDPTMKVAVVGPNAHNEEMQWGNYNGTPAFTTTLLEGLQAMLSPEQLIYEPLCGHIDVASFSSLFAQCAWEGKSGFKATYWNNLAFEGEPAAIDQLASPFKLDVGGNTVFAPGVALVGVTARFESLFTPEDSGRAVFRMGSNETVRIWVNGRLLADKTNVKIEAEVCEFEYRAGEQYEIRIEYAGNRRRNDAWLRLDMAKAVPQDIEGFLRRIADVDVVIFAGGISPRLEGEEMAVSAPGFRGGDRESIELPAIQRNTIEALHKAGKRIVMVNFSGSAIALEPETAHCEAILQAWYPGQAGGEALAEVLYGLHSPQGKLPVTFYRHTEQLPDFEDYAMRGHTYRYFTGSPLFAFGHGLSYTTFELGEVSADRSQLSVGESMQLTVSLYNRGEVAATEVLQLYLERLANDEGPQQTLRKFSHVSLQPGEGKQVTLDLSYDDFAWFNAATNRMTPLKGSYLVRVGGSSDKTLHRTLRVEIR